MGAVNVLTAVLAVRWTVMIAVVGGIALTAMAMMGNPDGYKLGLIGIYGALVVGPVVWLAATGRG